MPSISVVIPTHNRARIVSRAIRSVLTQTFQDFEILVVDDASKDDTEASVREIADGRIRYFRHDVGRGDGGARNTGVRNASGRYVAFLDDDDEWLPEKLRLQFEFCEGGGALLGGVHTGRWTIDSATGKASLFVVHGRDPSDLSSNWITTSTVLLRRSCFDAVGLFDETIPFNSDYDMWIRVSQRFRIGYLEQPLIRYFVHGSGLSGNPKAMIRGIEMLVAKHGEFFAANPKSHSRRYRLMGTLLSDIGNMRQARSAFLRAVRMNPRSVSNYVCLVLSFLGPGTLKKVRQFRAGHAG